MKYYKGEYISNGRYKKLKAEEFNENRDREIEERRKRIEGNKRFKRGSALRRALIYATLTHQNNIKPHNSI